MSFCSFEQAWIGYLQSLTMPCAAKMLLISCTSSDYVLTRAGGLETLGVLSYFPTTVPDEQAPQEQAFDCSW